MRNLLWLFFFITNSALALDAVVTVLEAPLLKSKNLNAPVVQYLRKGDVIKVHPSLLNERKYDEFAPAPEKLKRLQEQYENSAEAKADPLFAGKKPTVADAEDEFIPVLDRQGHQVYILSSHVYIYYENQKELTQSVPRKDPTDYRLQEPLPKKYPFFSPTGYRGQFIFGAFQPYTESYPYQAKFKTRGYQVPFDLNITLMKRVPSDEHDRFFYGITSSFRYYENAYSLVGGGLANERGSRMGFGPYLTYDAYKGEKDRVNLFTAVNFFPYNKIFITQSRSQPASETRHYQAYSLSPRMGVQYHRKGVLPEIDFILGSTVEVDLPTTYRSQEKARQAGYWRNQGSDNFTTRATLNLGAFVGVQSAY